MSFHEGLYKFITSRDLKVFIPFQIPEENKLIVLGEGEAETEIY